MEEFGFEPREITSSFTPEGGRRAGHEVAALRPLPTAVVAANDLIAVGAMGVFQAQGIRVPEDISVVGFDDSQIAQLDLIQLTSIRQQVDLFGTTAMSLLVDRIENRHHDPVLRLIETELMVRRTTGASPAVSRG
jgi:DNA-binding LacI/PurR family transcriptional regulator